MSASKEEIAKLIWDTSRADESSISCTGANIIANAILATFNVTLLPEPNYRALAEDAEYREYQAYKAANRGRVQRQAWETEFLGRLAYLYDGKLETHPNRTQSEVAEIIFNYPVGRTLNSETED